MQVCCFTSALLELSILRIETEIYESANFSDLEMTLTSEFLTPDFHELDAYTGNMESKLMLLHGK